MGNDRSGCRKLASLPSDRQSGSFEEPGRNVRVADQNEAAGAADATVLTFE